MDIRLSVVNIHTEYGLRIWTFVNPDRGKNYEIGPISGVRAPSADNLCGNTYGIQLGITVVRSDRIRPSLTSPDLRRALDGQDEHLTAALLAGVGRVGDSVDDVLARHVRDDALDRIVSSFHPRLLRACLNTGRSCQRDRPEQQQRHRER